MRMIGVTPSQDDKTGRITINQDYLDAITRAGALPVLLPLTAEERLCRAMLARVDGLVLSGGADVEPARYGEERLPCCGAAAPLRDAMEYALCRLAVAADKPVLGICRGLQVLNCALGGSLYQDIGLQYAQAITHPRYDAPRGQVHAGNAAGRNQRRAKAAGKQPPSPGNQGAGPGALRIRPGGGRPGGGGGDAGQAFHCGGAVASRIPERLRAGGPGAV